MSVESRLVLIAAPVAVAVAAVLYTYLSHGLSVVPSGIPVLGTAYAEISWSQFIDAANPDLPTQWAAFAFKLPCWLGLGMLIAFGLRKVRAEAPRWREFTEALFEPAG